MSGSGRRLRIAFVMDPLPAINIDKDRGDYLKMKRQLKNFELTMARDENHTSADQYGANALPFLVMVDKSGRVAHTWKGYPGASSTSSSSRSTDFSTNPRSPRPRAASVRLPRRRRHRRNRCRACRSRCPRAPSRRVFDSANGSCRASCRRAPRDRAAHCARP